MSEQKFKEIAQKLSASQACVEGKMFGKACVKTAGNKAFAAFFKGEMVFKLGQEDVGPLKLKYSNSQNWDPSGKGRPMKDWLPVPVDYSDEWGSLADKAYQYLNQ